MSTQPDIAKLINAALVSGDPDLIVAASKLMNSAYLNFRPRPDNPELLDEQSSFVNDQFAGIACVLGGTGSGKSRSAAYKLAKYITDNPPPDRETRFWVLCQTLEMAISVCWVQHLEEFLPDAKVRGWYSEKKRLPDSVEIRNKNGNKWVIEFKSYDMGREALQAASIAGFWADEQIEHSLLTEVDARTRNYRLKGNKFYTLTPLRPDYELEKKVAEQEKHPGWKFYRLNSELNPEINLSFLDGLLDQDRQTRLTGAFASYSGAVYRNFGSQHVVQPFDIPQGWQRVAGIDFGWDHPTVCLFGAKDPGGRFWIYDEYVQNKNSIEDHVEALKEKWKPGARDYGDMWADYAAAQDRHEFSIRGLPTRAAHKDVLPGIAKVQELLRNGADGKPRLLIFKNCENLLREMRTYIWHPNIANRPLKKEDDCVDSLRMLVYSDGRDLKPLDLKMPESRFKHR